MPERGYYNWTPLGTGLITETSSLGAAGGESQSSVTLSSPPICSLLLYWPSNINQLINKQKVGNYRWNSKIKSELILSHVFCLYPLPPWHWWRWWMYLSSFRLPSSSLLNTVHLIITNSCTAAVPVESFLGKPKVQMVDNEVFFGTRLCLSIQRAVCAADFFLYSSIFS